MDHVRRSTRPRVMKKKSDILYFDDQKIELNEEERDLIYPNERAREKKILFLQTYRRRNYWAINDRMRFMP